MAVKLHGRDEVEMKYGAPERSQRLEFVVTPVDITVAAALSWAKISNHMWENFSNMDVIFRRKSSTLGFWRFAPSLAVFFTDLTSAAGDTMDTNATWT